MPRSKPLSYAIVRTEETPFRASRRKIHRSFTVFGERFAVVRCRKLRKLYRAVHVATGAAVPGIFLPHVEMVRRSTQRDIHAVGRAKLTAAIEKIKARLKLATDLADEGASHSPSRNQGQGD